MTDQKRVTIIEILIVVAVIGLIGTLSAVAVSSARANSRDAVRLSNTRQVQVALENFFMARSSYPITGNIVALGYGSAGCLSTDGFQSACDATTEGVLIKTVPVAPDNGLNGLSSCGGVANAFCYLAIKDGDSYVIQFELEHAIASAELQRGLNCATPEGMKAGACSAE